MHGQTLIKSGVNYNQLYESCF